MIPQTYPLYTVRNGVLFLVAGWVHSAGTESVFPVLAPMDQPGRTFIYRGTELMFSPTPPVVLPEPVDPDATAFIPAYRSAW